jgi:Pyruvate/2-oxoacid:ferredoxin oxidoreductase gamma subunit
MGWERELIVTGIGGQGVQLASAVVARAAVLEGRQVQLFGSYGGMMRGGATETTLVFADGPVEAPPTVAETWSAVVMHHEHAGHAWGCLGPRSVVFLNSSVVDPAALSPPPGSSAARVVEVPATDLALEVGNVMVASMVMIGAYAAATGMVALASLAEAARASLPSYRAQHAALNDDALGVGFAAVAAGSVPAWAEAAAVAR